MGYGGSPIEKIYPEVAEAAKKEAVRDSEDFPNTSRAKAKEFERRFRARDTLPPTKWPQED